jgi:hypothetical protein
MGVAANLCPWELVRGSSQQSAPIWIYLAIGSSVGSEAASRRRRGKQESNFLTPETAFIARSEVAHWEIGALTDSEC